MRQLHSIVFLSLLGTVVVGCSLSEKPALRLSEGDEYRQKVTLVSSLNMFMPDIDHREVEMILAHHVEDVDDKGVATMRISIESIKASMRSMTIKCRYDSQDEVAGSPKAGGEQAAGDISRQAKYDRAFGGLAKTGYRVRVDDQGQILEVFDVDGRLESYRSEPVENTNFGGAELSLLFSSHNLREYVLPQVLREVDAAALKADGRWRVAGVVRGVQTGSALAEKTVRLEEVEERATGRVARMKMDVSPTESESLPEYIGTEDGGGLNFEIVGGTVKGAATPRDPDDLAGEIVFAMDKGYLVSAEEKYSAEIRLRGMGRGYGKKNPNRKKSSFVISTTIERLEP